MIPQELGFRLVMRDEHDGDVEGHEMAAQVFAQLAAQAGVERGERLVEQQQARLGDKRTREGDALLLTAGDLTGAAMSLLIEAKALNDFVHAGLAFGLSGSARRPYAMFSATLRCGKSA